MSSNRRFRGRANVGRETYDLSGKVVAPKKELDTNASPQISLDVVKDEYKATNEVIQETDDLVKETTESKDIIESTDSIKEVVKSSEIDNTKPSDNIKTPNTSQSSTINASKAAIIAKLITNLAHDLPPKYKEMSFNYKFMDVVKHGHAHHLRGKLTINIENYQSNLKTSIPSSYSLKDHVGHILNQGTLGACVSHSAVQALYIVMNKTETSRWSFSRLLSSNSAFYASRLYIYYNSRLLDGSSAYEDNGCTNISACIALSEYKACNEREWPYDPTRFSAKPPHQAYLDAGTFKSFKYSAVKQSASELKRAIAGGHPVMIGIVVFSSFIHSGLNGGSGVWSGPHSGEHPIGGHSLLVVGYDDDKQLFTIVNHWGTEWGSSGYGFISYSYLENPDYSGDFCAIETFA